MTQDTATQDLTSQEEENREIAKRMVEEVFDKGNLDAIDELVAEDFVDHDAPPGMVIRGPEGSKNMIRTFRKSFPDMSFEALDVITQGDRVVVRGVMRGTHQGPLMGFPPTHKRFEGKGVSILRISGGKVREHWGATDMLGILMQLGIDRIPSNPQH